MKTDTDRPYWRTLDELADDPAFQERVVGGLTAGGIKG